MDSCMTIHFLNQAIVTIESFAIFILNKMFSKTYAF
jgi:hypothetical protein